MGSNRQQSDYRTGGIVIFVIMGLGLVLEIFWPVDMYFHLSFPLNAEVGILFLSLLFLLHAYYQKRRWIKWLRSIPAAISAITLFTLLSLMMGFIPQVPAGPDSFITELGIYRIKETWYFAFSGFFLLSALGFTIFHRLKKLNIRNIGFVLNHFGLFLVILAGSLGSADLYKLTISLREGESSMYGQDRASDMYRLPFRIRLNDFQMDAYAPKMVLLENKDGSVSDEIRPNPVEMQSGDEITMLSRKVSIIQIHENAMITEQGVMPAPDTVPGFSAALIRVVSETPADTLIQWITPGNNELPPVFLKLNPQFSLAMMKPQAREYRSRVTVTSNEHTTDHVIKVNKPIKVKGWKLYQSGYDQSRGKASDISIIEAVRDPWLPVVYTGFFMVLLGGLYLLWKGKQQKQK